MNLKGEIGGNENSDTVSLDDDSVEVAGPDEEHEEGEEHDEAEDNSSTGDAYSSGVDGQQLAKKEEAEEIKKKLEITEYFLFWVKW